MTPIEAGWGSGPTKGYDRLADRFRPLFDRIRAGAVERDRGRVLPVEPLHWLKEAGFGAVRVPVADGGSGATLPELFALLVELAAADSNLAQALRSHFGFVEEVLNTADAAKRARWLPRIVAGETMGSARSEAGASKRDAFSTTIHRAGDGTWRLDGAKFYSTGSLYADWLHVAATRAEDGASVTAIVPRHALGVTVVDDWDGFGQILTASGTSRFVGVRVPDRDVMLDADIFPYTLPFYQTVHLATLAGIGRAAATEAADAVAARTRTYSHAAASASRVDPQILQVIGQVRGAAYAAGTVALKVAEAVGRVADDARAGRVVEASLAVAEVESGQAQTVVSTLVLEATTALFDALGASAVLRTAGLDRHWRNARTITSHNPRIYKDRIVGDFAVNGTPPPRSWRVGET